MNRKDFQVLSKVRLREAKVLLGVGLYDGAYYLAGYAVECGLKACIAKRTLRHDFRGLTAALEAHVAEDLLFRINWDIQGDVRRRAFSVQSANGITESWNG